MSNEKTNKSYDNGRVFQTCENCSNYTPSNSMNSTYGLHIKQVCSDCKITPNGLSNWKEIVSPVIEAKTVSASDKNNGGQTDYYSLPLPKKDKIDEILRIRFGVLTGVSLEGVVNAIVDLCPKTLSDLIEHKKMKPWQHEVIKATYAIDKRAEKNGGSELRELNKIIFFANRRKAELEGRTWE